MVYGSPPSEIAWPRTFGSPSKRVAPEALAEHGHARASGAVLVGAEGAAEPQGGAEQAEELARHAAGAKLLREVPSGEVDDAGVESGDGFGDRILLAVVLELGRRGVGARAFGLVLMKKTRRSAWGKARGRSNTALTTEKMAVLTPMPRVRAATAASAKAGLWEKMRRACRTSRSRVSGIALQCLED